MIHHHLTQIVSHVVYTGRHVLTFCHAASRSLLVMFYRLESPRGGFRAALRQASIERPGKLPKTRQAIRRRTPLLIHYHIFKNAGTSFEWALEQVFGAGLRRLDTPSHDGFISSRDIAECAEGSPGIRAIASHQAAPKPTRIRGRNVLTSILIRDPIARIRSIYAFERLQERDDPGSQKAKELDFKHYVEWRLQTTPRMFCNFQVYFCCREGANDRRIPDAADLERAIHSLDTIDVVGTVERYVEWLALANSVLRTYFGQISLPFTRQNVLTGERSSSKETIYRDLIDDLGAARARYLLDRNELDMCLHQVADALLSRRLAERRVHVALRQTYLSVDGQGNA